MSVEPPKAGLPAGYLLTETSKTWSQLHDSRDRGARGITILELLIVVSVLALLASLLLPAVQAAREATRGIQCVNNLGQVVHALQMYYDEHRSLPMGIRSESSTKSSYGWASSILRELEEAALSNTFNHDSRLDQTSDVPRSTSPAVYLCPSDSGEPTFPMYAEMGRHGTRAQASGRVLVVLPRANYVGVFGTFDPDDNPGESGDGTFVKNKCVGFAELTRGMSNTLIVGERTTRKLASTWIGIMTRGEDANGRIVGYAYLGPNRDDADECEFDSRHPGHVNFAYGDGHVAAIHDDIEPTVYRELAQLR